MTTSKLKCLQYRVQRWKKLAISHADIFANTWSIIFLLQKVCLVVPHINEVFRAMSCQVTTRAKYA